MLTILRKCGSGLSSFTEKWVPDAWVICMILTLTAIFLCIFGVGTSIEETILAWGEGVWSLLGLGMQFTIAMVAAHACVSSRPIYKLFSWLSSLPNKKRTHPSPYFGRFIFISYWLSKLGALPCGLCSLHPFYVTKQPKS